MSDFEARQAKALEEIARHMKKTAGVLEALNANMATIGSAVKTWLDELDTEGLALQGAVTDEAPREVEQAARDHSEWKTDF